MIALPFLTALDPVSRTSGSIDPLGALQPYGALVEQFLPGITTITTRSRYLSMLCWALANCDKHRRFAPGPSGLVARRLAIEPFERVWAVACVVARDAGNASAAFGLRGVTFAASWLKQCQERERVTPNYSLLQYQSRAAGGATYWSTLVGADLIQDDGTLHQAGRELAHDFPEIPLNEADCAKLADPTRCRQVAIPLDDLTNWARRCHLAAASPSEQVKLREALGANVRRYAIADALKSYAATAELPQGWSSAHLRRFSRLLPESELHLPEVVSAILVFERFHESLLSAFQTLLWWGTERSDVPVRDLYADAAFTSVVDDARKTSQDFLAFDKPLDRHGRVRATLETLHPLAQNIARSRDPRAVTEAVLAHHKKVKPVRTWIIGDAGRLLRPAARYQLTDRPRAATGKYLTHPYRIESFVRMLIENRALERPQSWDEGVDA